MVTLVRVEAEAETLGEIVEELDVVQAALRKAAADVRVHDEHYERIHSKKMKGRRVFRVGEPAGASTLSTLSAVMTGSSAADVQWSYTTG